LRQKNLSHKSQKRSSQRQKLRKRRETWPKSYMMLLSKGYISKDQTSSILLPIQRRRQKRLNQKCLRRRSFSLRSVRSQRWLMVQLKLKSQSLKKVNMIIMAESITEGTVRVAVRVMVEVGDAMDIMAIKKTTKIKADITEVATVDIIKSTIAAWLAHLLVLVLFWSFMLFSNTSNSKPSGHLRRSPAKRSGVVADNGERIVDQLPGKVEDGVDKEDVDQE